jgi:ferrous iron transport protein A
MKVILKLSDMEENQIGIIKMIEKFENYERLLEMGVLPEETIEVKKIALLGDPMIISVTGYNLMLRKKDAKNILVEVSF